MGNDDARPQSSGALAERCGIDADFAGIYRAIDPDETEAFFCMRFGDSALPGRAG